MDEDGHGVPHGIGGYVDYGSIYSSAEAVTGYERPPSAGHEETYEYVNHPCLVYRHFPSKWLKAAQLDTGSMATSGSSVGWTCDAVVFACGMRHRYGEAVSAPGGASAIRIKSSRSCIR